MTLTPLIVAICVNAGPTYDEACKAAAEQGAAQSGFAGSFEQTTSKMEKQTIKFINPSAEVETAVAVLGYSVHLLSGRQAVIALPNPGIKNSSLSFGIGKELTTLGFVVNF